ncbi:hypothetical protein K435DRAFT_803008 [Dendrothele bispora CBS 962.96]|uniref:DUF6533 domain-containing protein n=1 Tax=Dendrothele bispora (strain CBS 962.96) TaxID=1314807 RepID=A0A4S8LIZ1_DENBC|nr:hypothetical protein K435DRAFT_803008 [Dendrothele bispora CBS 962.96]
MSPSSSVSSPNHEFSVLDQATQASHYAAVSSLMMVAWDILTNIDGEIELYFERKLRIPTVVYMFCRIASIFYALVATLFLGKVFRNIRYPLLPLKVNIVLDIPNCEETEFIIPLIPLAVAASTNSVSFLFLLRVHAVFHEKRKAQIFFTTFWVISAATSGLYFKFGDAEQSIVDPRKCAFRELHPATSLVAMGFFMVFDTMGYNTELPLSLLGDVYPHFRGAFYETDNYIIRGIPVIMLSILPSIPTQYNPIVNIPYTTLLSVLACYVFRSAKLGKIREESLSIPSLQILSQKGRADNLRSNDT